MKKDKNDEFLGVLNEKYNKEFFTNPSKELKDELEKTGILVLRKFLSDSTLQELQREAATLKKDAFRTESVYNVYVKPEDKSLPPGSPRNKKLKSTKGIIADDQIPQKSLLRKIYEAGAFRGFVSKMERLIEIFPYSDKLSSINYNYYNKDDSLEWHFDNADFATTLLVKTPEKGGNYEYFPNIRYTKDGQEDYETVGKILNSKLAPETEKMAAGDLMIFRGNKSLHRVTPVLKGERILVTLNYNEKPGIALSEKSRKTFFGRTE